MHSVKSAADGGTWGGGRGGSGRQARAQKACVMAKSLGFLCVVESPQNGFLYVNFIYLCFKQ